LIMHEMPQIAARDRAGSGFVRFSMGLVLALTVGFNCAFAGQAQSGNGQPSGNQNSGQGPSMRNPALANPNYPAIAGDNELDPVMYERRMLALNVQRQKQLVSDTDKLLKLAKELNDEVASSKGSLTGDQMRKLSEIEKLARNVRERMTNGVGQPANLLTPAEPIGFPTH
jgi:hypothetical protein